MSHGEEFKYYSKYKSNLLQYFKQENEIIYFKQNPKGKEAILNLMCPEN